MIKENSKFICYIAATLLNSHSAYAEASYPNANDFTVYKSESSDEVLIIKNNKYSFYIAGRYFDYQDNINSVGKKIELYKNNSCIKFESILALGRSKKKVFFCGGWRIKKIKKIGNNTLYYGYCSLKESYCAINKRIMVAEEYLVDKKGGVVYFKIAPSIRNSVRYKYFSGKKLSIP